MGVPIGTGTSQGVYHPENKNRNAPAVSGVAAPPPYIPPPFASPNPGMGPMGVGTSPVPSLLAGTAYDPILMAQAWARATPNRSRGSKFLEGFGQSFNPNNWIEMLKHEITHPKPIWERDPENGWEDIKRMVTTPEGLGGLTAALIPLGPKGVGLARAESGAARVKGYPTGSATNDIGALGAHADIAERVLANKAFDQAAAASKRSADLEKAPSLGEILKENQAPGYKSAPEARSGGVQSLRGLDESYDRGMVGSPSTQRQLKIELGLRGAPRTDQRVHDFAGMQERLAALWERGDSEVGRYLSQPREAPHNMGPDVPDFMDSVVNENPFDWQPPKDLSAEAHGIPKVSRQEKNYRGYEAGRMAQNEQGLAALQDPHMRAQKFFETAFGSPVETMFNGKINPEIDALVGRARATRASSGGTGYPRYIVEGAMGDAQTWLANLLRSPMGLRRAEYGN